MVDAQVPKGGQPLSGYRVLDLSGPPGVYCGKLMADMGADVIKIEPPGGDPMRCIGPFVDDRSDQEASLYWHHFATNRRSITLDITHIDGAALLRRLASESDVVLETFQPGFLDALGLGYGDLESHNPALVFASITPFSQTGPYRDYKGSDLVGLAMGGYLYVTGWPDTPPTRLWGSQAYHTAANRALVAILLALYYRLGTGKGQRVDVSVQEAVAATTEHVNMGYIYEGRPAVRSGFRHGGQFVATWRCKDGYVSITTGNQKSWRDLRAWMAEEGMAGDLMDEKYDDRIVLRGEHSDHIEALIGAWAMQHTRREITEWGQSRGYPFAPAATAAEVLTNPQLWDRGFFTEVEFPEYGKTFVYSGAPYQLPESPWKLRTTAPHVGQHNREIYVDEMGISSEELERLTAAGVV